MMEGYRVINHPSYSDKQVEEIVKLLLEAFSEERSILPMIGGKEDLRSDFYSLAVRTAILEGKVTVCEEVQTGRILSLACSYGPGYFFLGSKAQRDLGFEEFFRKLPSEGQQWWDNYFSQVKNMPEVVINSWFVTIMATATNEQGKGYGSSVMREVQRMATADETTVKLNTTSEKNVAFYTGLGFKVMHAFPRTTPYGSWTSYIMTWGPE